MKSGRRGRRGGRRQRRREADAKARAEEQGKAESAGKPIPAAEAAAGKDASASRPSEVTPADAGASAPRVPRADAGASAPQQPSAVPDPAAVPHPRPMSARELVARLEARRAEGPSAAGRDATQEQQSGAAHESVKAANGAQHDRPRRGGATHDVAETVEPRRFTVAGQEWVATVAGRGTGGTGRVAQARLEAIRFSTSAEPERVAAEVLVAGSGLDTLYDDELAELLERGLRSRKGNG